MRIIQSYNFMNMLCHFIQCVSNYTNSESRLYFSLSGSFWYLAAWIRCAGAVLSEKIILGNFIDLHLWALTGTYIVFELSRANTWKEYNFQPPTPHGYSFPARWKRRNLATVISPTWPGSIQKTNCCMADCGLPYPLHGVLLLKVLKVPNFLFSGPHMVCCTTFFLSLIFFIPKKMFIWKLTGSPPLMWWIFSFISGYKGIALLNNFMPSFL